MSRLTWILAELAGRLWVRATLYGVVAVMTALAAIYLKYLIPEDWQQKMGADAVDGILNIMAASMLSVTIFSLSTMVSAYSAATSHVTPRATKLLIEDRISHVALSTFIGAFIFSMVGIVALKTGVYGETGRVILFGATVGVIAMVVVTLLRWIEYLVRLGRVNETIAVVEKAATAALEMRFESPYLGGQPLRQGDIPSSAVPVPAAAVGYVQHIDMGRLAAIAEEKELAIYVQSPPGKFVDAHYPLVLLSQPVDDAVTKDVRAAFIINHERTFRQDPRFGLAVLGEIAMRALSPAVNDPGTAIYVIGAGVRILSIWAERDALAVAQDGVQYAGVYVPPLVAEDLFDDLYSGIARDGAAMIEVQIRLQKAYDALIRTGDADLAGAARQQARIALQWADEKLVLKLEKERLSKVAAI